MKNCTFYSIFFHSNFIPPKKFPKMLIPLILLKLTQTIGIPDRLKLPGLIGLGSDTASTKPINPNPSLVADIVETALSFCP